MIITNSNSNIDVFDLQPTSQYNLDSTEDSNSTGNDIAASLSLSNNIQDQLRLLNQLSLSKPAIINVSDYAKDANDDTHNTNTQISQLIKKCSFLGAKASNKDLSKGQRTYIQFEINRIKHAVSGITVAV